MSGIELNKIAASILLASLIAMLVGMASNILYKPKLDIATRGYQVEGVTDVADGAPKEEAPIDIPTLMANANVEEGAKVVKKCISCHSLEKGGSNKIGPNIWDVVDKPIGKKAGFVYSKAMAGLDGNWDQEHLFHFLHKPSKYLPGTKMAFIGLSKPQDIANLIAFLKEKAI